MGRRAHCITVALFQRLSTTVQTKCIALNLPTSVCCQPLSLLPPWVQYCNSSSACEKVSQLMAQSYSLGWEIIKSFARNTKRKNRKSLIWRCCETDILSLPRHAEGFAICGKTETWSSFITSHPLYSPLKLCERYFLTHESPAGLSKRTNLLLETHS